MKRQLLSVFICLVVTTLFSITHLKAQPITINSSDMPSANDTVRLSIAPITTPGIDLTITGADTTWDFSQLQWNSQTVDTFQTVFSTGFIYQLAFFSSSFAQKAADISGLPGVALTDVLNFYGKNSTLFKQTGIGATLNGVQTPLIFTSKDVIYRFPLNFGDQDTSDAVYGIAIPGLGSYDATQKRINIVDGWGTLTTPYGSFDCLRVKSELTGHDSVYITASSTGFGFDRLLTREYKWLAIGKKVPVLQINTQELIPGNEIITSIVYRDSARVLVTGIQEADDQLQFSVYPNPADESINIKTVLTQPAKLIYELINAEGKLVYTDNETASTGITNKIISIVEYPQGLYILRLIGENRYYSKRIIISKK